MKTFTLLLLLICFMGCTSPVIQKDGTIMEFTTVIIDGCQYIAVERRPETQFAVFAITHKGNCTNHNNQ